jgi:hypothetical protein
VVVELLIAIAGGQEFCLGRLDFEALRLPLDLLRANLVAKCSDLLS